MMIKKKNARILKGIMLGAILTAISLFKFHEPIISTSTNNLNLNTIISTSTNNLNLNTIINESEDFKKEVILAESICALTNRIIKTPVEEIAEEKETSITINFMGDCMLATLYGSNFEGSFNYFADNQKPTYFFDNVNEYLEQGTFNIANCENVFTDDDLPQIIKNYTPAFWFKSPSKNARIFKENGIDLVSIANNHAYDYCNQGRTDTINALENAGVLWGDDNKAIVLEYEGIKIAVFCVTLWRWDMPNGLSDEIKEMEKTTDLQIVYFHGGTERLHQPDEFKIQYSRAFVDAGADLVIGSHPHVLQPIEKYKGVNIVYSLGNFVYGGNSAPENRTIIYQHTFKFKDKTLQSQDSDVLPCYIYTGNFNEYQPTPIENETDKKAVIDFLYNKTASPFPY